MEQEFVNFYFYASLFFTLISMFGLFLMALIAKDSNTENKPSLGLIIIIMVFLIIYNGYHTLKSYSSPKLTWEQRKNSWIYTDSVEKGN